MNIAALKLLADIGIAVLIIVWVLGMFLLFLAGSIWLITGEFDW